MLPIDGSTVGRDWESPGLMLLFAMVVITKVVPCEMGSLIVSV